LKFGSQTQPFTSLLKACISQTLEYQIPWIIDSSAFNHISGNASLFSSISHPKVPYVIIFTNGSKVSSQGVG